MSIYKGDQSPYLRKIIDEIKLNLKRIYGDDLSKVVLYGSQARGEANSASDIDIAVILDKDFNKYEEIDIIVDYIYDISLRYDELISVLPLSVDEYDHGIYPIFENIRSEGVVV